MEDEYVVYRNRSQIYFINPIHKELVENKIDTARRMKMGTGTALTYMAEMVIDIRSNTVIKNRYPDREWPRQVFNEVFSGVSNATYI